MWTEAGDCSNCHILAANFPCCTVPLWFSQAVLLAPCLCNRTPASPSTFQLQFEPNSFGPDDRGSKFLQNISTHVKHYTVSKPEDQNFNDKTCLHKQPNEMTLNDTLSAAQVIRHTIGKVWMMSHIRNAKPVCNSNIAPTTETNEKHNLLGHTQHLPSLHLPCSIPQHMDKFWISHIFQQVKSIYAQVFLFEQPVYIKELWEL
jgi:hypothetical protein